MPDDTAVRMEKSHHNSYSEIPTNDFIQSRPVKETKRSMGGRGHGGGAPLRPLLILPKPDHSKRSEHPVIVNQPIPTMESCMHRLSFDGQSRGSAGLGYPNYYHVTPEGSSSSRRNSSHLTFINNNHIQGIDSRSGFPPQYTGCRYDVAKPPYSYASLIAQALLSTPSKKLTLNQIYAWIMEKYPYYRSENHGWQNSIRHNLSLNSCFVKLGKNRACPSSASSSCSSIRGEDQRGRGGAGGKGSYWTLNEEELAAFKDGEFKRRKLNGKGRMRKKRRRNGGKSDSTNNNSHNNKISRHSSNIANSICDTDQLISETSNYPVPPPYQPFYYTASQALPHPSSSHTNLRSSLVNTPPPMVEWRGMSTFQSRMMPAVNYNEMELGSWGGGSDVGWMVGRGGVQPMGVEFTCELMLQEERWQRDAFADVRTDYTDPLEILEKI